MNLTIIKFKKVMIIKQMRSIFMKIKVLFVPICLLVIIMLSACTNNDSTDPVSHISPTPEAESSEDADNSENDILYNAFSDIDNSFSLLSALQDVLADIDVNEIVSVKDINVVDEDLFLTLDFVIKTDIRTLKVSMLTLKSEFSDNGWEVSYIRDFKTKKSYWLPEGQKTYYDLYDYTTGKLISKKKKELTEEEIMKNSNDTNQEISDNFDKALDDLADKYNIDKK